MEPSPDRIAILLPLGIAVSITFCTVIIHALAHDADDLLRPLRVEAWPRRRPVLEGRSDSSGATLVALAAHLVAVTTWALVFSLCGEFSQLAPALYHSGMNYTTLGDSDKVMSPSWRLLASSRSGKRDADVWRVNRYAVCRNSATIPNQIQRTKQS